MNVNNRLDYITKHLPKPAPKANPFASLTDEEIVEIDNDLATLVKQQLADDPNAINTINPEIIRYLKTIGLLKV